MGIITAEATENPEPQPLVPWWSFSKTVLAAAVLAVVDRRKLDLDAPITGAPYTLRHLLQHTSGLPDYGPNPEYHRAVAAGESPWTVDELLRRVNASTLLFAPGARFSYSNIGYLLVRQIIERAADADLNGALRTLVFDPMGIGVCSWRARRRTSTRSFGKTRSSTIRDGCITDASSARCRRRRHACIA